MDIAKTWRDVSGGTNGTKWLLDSAERLSKTSIRWSSDDGWDGVTVFLSGLAINRDNGTLIYSFPSFLRKQLVNNQEFSRLRIRFALGLAGKYTIPLYTILEGIVGLNKPVLEIGIDELRQRLNVEEGKLIDWRDFKKFALDPAMDRINEGSEQGGIIATYHTISRSGRKVTSVEFTALKTPERLSSESQFSRKIGKDQAKKTESSIPSFSCEDYDSFKTISLGQDIYAVEQEWREWCASKSITPNTPRGHFIAFLMRKAKPSKN
jgi:hypothetical protein